MLRLKDEPSFPPIDDWKTSIKQWKCVYDYHNYDEGWYRILSVSEPTSGHLLISKVSDSAR